MFLPGIGAGPDSWGAQVNSLPAGFAGVALQNADLGGDGAGFTLSRAAAGLVDELDRRGIGRAHLCGLSLGAMIALQAAIEHPARVASLVLSGGQVRPPRVLMTLQSAVLRVLPERAVAPPGMSKRDVLAVLRAVGRTDFRHQLAGIAAPTLVLCGSKDLPNRPAARALAAGIPTARLRIIRGAGHEINTQLPDAFNAELARFLPCVAGRNS